VIPPDYHLHTTFSCDGKTSMVEMCQAAIRGGFQEIGFSEHYDLNTADECYDWLKVEAWFAEIERCRRQYVGQLIIRAGVEFSEPHLYPQGLKSLLSRIPFDYVIGSLHYLGDELIFTDGYFLKRTADQAFQEYFTELEKMTRAGEFDILGHLDIIALTARSLYGNYNPSQYEDAIRPVLGNCIQRGILPEINTQGLRKPAQLLVPGLEILRWYVEMGGENIVLGSDAHSASQLGLHLDIALKAAREAGLKMLTRFEKREPRLIALTDID
jgi:histidinol-phosphatase (PHP family)